ncbi:isocitrate lyase/PEP mutase family protein [Solirubrobacter soli]|uniref:isocitrate lyase/PEP mutase family protein n=1 Tax=Solirubrobacter soli TaxID=363832 RepID=UPI00041DB81E|nr:isocitrate lyase/phosphoenolpyruvate mutase family protein [Solirubrobacter soli]
MTAAEFAARHKDGPIVVVPNAFDVASARVMARLRPVAIGTSSMAIARGLGYDDGERIPRDEMLGAIKRIVDGVDVPVTADVEAGYGDAAGTAERLLEIGVIGLNIEDARQGALLSVEDATANIAAIRRVAGSNLVINARVDSWLDPGDDADVVVERGNAYLAAGADCVFAPGISDVSSVVDRLDGPLNAYVSPATPSIPELEALGVRRVSVGNAPYDACLRLVERIATDLLTHGRFDALFA